jgi:AGZA family xanthine/uracil permease-like MFS transporter
MYVITGISGLLWAAAGVVPSGAIAAIFVWLAVVIAEVAAVQSPKKHIPAVLITFIPAGAYLLQGQLSGAISALGVSMDEAIPKLAAAGIDLQAINTLSYGFALVAIIWGTALACMLDGNLRKASIWYIVGAVLAAIGLMHSPGFGTMAPIPVIVGYIILGAACLAASPFVKPELKEEKT